MNLIGRGNWIYTISISCLSEHQQEQEQQMQYATSPLALFFPPFFKHYFVWRFVSSVVSPEKKNLKRKERGQGRERLASIYHFHFVGSAGSLHTSSLLFLRQEKKKCTFWRTLREKTYLHFGQWDRKIRV